MFETDILHALLSLLQVNGGRLKQKNTTFRKIRIIMLVIAMMMMMMMMIKIAIIFPTITLSLEIHTAK